MSRLGGKDRAHPEGAVQEEESSHLRRSLVSRCLEEEHQQVFQPYLLGKLQRDDAFRLRLHTLPPELEFGINGSVKHKVLFQTLGVEGADRRVVAHLLRYEPEAQILSATSTDRTHRRAVMYYQLAPPLATCCTSTYLTSS